MDMCQQGVNGKQDDPFLTQHALSSVFTSGFNLCNILTAVTILVSVQFRYFFCNCFRMDNHSVDLDEVHGFLDALPRGRAFGYYVDRMDTWTREHDFRIADVPCADLDMFMWRHMCDDALLEETLDGFWKKMIPYLIFVRLEHLLDPSLETAFSRLLRRGLFVALFLHDPDRTKGMFQGFQLGAREAILGAVESSWGQELQPKTGPRLIEFLKALYEAGVLFDDRDRELNSYVHFDNGFWEPDENFFVLEGTPASVYGDQETGTQRLPQEFWATSGNANMYDVCVNARTLHAIDCIICEADIF